MQSVSSRIWTRVAVFISYDDNNYTTMIIIRLAITDLACYSSNEDTPAIYKKDFILNLLNFKL